MERLHPPADREAMVAVEGAPGFEFSPGADAHEAVFGAAPAGRRKADRRTSSDLTNKECVQP